MRTQGLIRTSRSAISVPSTIVRPTFATVKTTVRTTVSQKTRVVRARSRSCPARSSGPGAGSARRARTARTRGGRACRSGSRGCSPTATATGDDQAVRRPGNTAAPPGRERPRPGGDRRVDAGLRSQRPAPPSRLLRRVQGVRDVVARRRGGLLDGRACRSGSGHSIVRRILPFSTLTQFFAAGTNQLRSAARSFDLRRVQQVGRVRDVARPPAAPSRRTCS